MKKHPSLRRTQRSNHQSVGKLKAAPSKKTTKRVKPSRKFGDDLTNVSIHTIFHQDKSCQKNMSVLKPNLDCLEDYHSDIENHLLQEDVDFYSYLTSTMEYAPNIKITSDMRRILIKWLVQVSNRFGCLSETLHMAIQLIDILLVQKGLLFDKKNFQLLGITSLFIACKYNQIQVPECDKFLYVCDGLYDFNNLVQMQATVLLTINFNLQLPSLFNFLHIELKNHRVDLQCKQFIDEFSSYCLLDFTLMNNFKKSQIALLLIYFSTKVINKKSINSIKIFQKSGIRKKSLQAGIQIMFKLYNLYKKQQNKAQ